MRKVVATPAGVRTRTDLELRVREAEGELLSALDAGEREMFRSLLRKVAACDLRNIEPETDPCDVAEQVLAYVSPPAHGKA